MKQERAISYAMSLLIVALTFVQCSIQNSTQPNFDNDIYRGADRGQKDRPIGRPGACYAKCLMPDLYDRHETDYFVYTGVDPSSKTFVSTEVVEVSPPSTKWVKKRADRNCLSDNPDDCMVWCLVNDPGEHVTLHLVTDTTLTKDFNIETITRFELSEKRGYTEWQEVLCNNRVSQGFILELQAALAERGYDPGPSSKTVDSKMKAALSQYQRENQLPIGQLDFQTLHALEIEY